MLPSIRVFVVESAAAPDAKLFAVRHAQGYLCRDNGGNVVLGTDRADVDRQRRQLNLASVAHVVALVPESEVGVEATSPPLARLMQAAGELGMVLVQEGGDLRLRRLSLDAVPAPAEGQEGIKAWRRTLEAWALAIAAGHDDSERPIKINGSDLDPTRDQVRNPSEPPQETMPDAPTSAELELGKQAHPNIQPDPQQASQGQGETPTAETKPEPKRKKK